MRLQMRRLDAFEALIISGLIGIIGIIMGLLGFIMCASTLWERTYSGLLMWAVSQVKGWYLPVLPV